MSNCSKNNKISTIYFDDYRSCVSLEFIKNGDVKKSNCDILKFEAEKALKKEQRYFERCIAYEIINNNT